VDRDELNHDPLDPDTPMILVGFIIIGLSGGLTGFGIGLFVGWLWL
jgi:hypothetical protein